MQGPARTFTRPPSPPTPAPWRTSLEGLASPPPPPPPRPSFPRGVSFPVRAFQTKTSEGTAAPDQHAVISGEAERGENRRETSRRRPRTPSPPLLHPRRDASRAIPLTHQKQPRQGKSPETEAGGNCSAIELNEGRCAPALLPQDALRRNSGRDPGSLFLTSEPQPTLSCSRARRVHVIDVHGCEHPICTMAALCAPSFLPKRPFLPMLL